MMTRAHLLFAALAIIDAIALLYVAAQFPWVIDPPRVGETPAGWIVLVILYILELGFRALALAFIGAIAYAIVREVRGGWQPSRLAATFVSFVLAAGLALVLFVAWKELAEALQAPRMQLADRLAVLDRLAERHDPGRSLGAWLAILALAAYLGEKYLLRWWRLRWPVSVAALAILAWPVWAAIDGEREQREWVGAQQWRPIAESKTWIEALAACNVLGAEWRLPRRTELALYAAAADQATAGWKGAAWTPTVSELGRNAVVVELAPRYSGYWRSNLIPWRDRSACERNANESGPNDWFTRILPAFCEMHADREGLHVSTLQLIAQIRGRVGDGPNAKWLTRETEAATICIRPAPPEIQHPRRRVYPREEEFREPGAFLERMAAVCNPPVGGSDAAACAAFGEPAARAAQ